MADWNRRLPAGFYQMKVDLARVCQNGASDGNGYLALYEATGEADAEPDHSVREDLDVSEFIADLQRILAD